MGTFPLTYFCLQTAADISSVRKEHYYTRRGNFCDNIAAVVMGTFECNEEEKLFLEAVEEKYEVLRDSVLLSILMIENGPTWKRYVKFIHFPNGRLKLPDICI